MHFWVNIACCVSEALRPLKSIGQWSLCMTPAPISRLRLVTRCRHLNYVHRIILYIWLEALADCCDGIQWVGNVVVRCLYEQFPSYSRAVWYCYVCKTLMHVRSCKRYKRAIISEIRRLLPYVLTPVNVSACTFCEETLHRYSYTK